LLFSYRQERTSEEREVMKIAELMTKDVRTCSPDDTLERAAQIMSEKDCDVVPVADDEGRTVGVVTDRDICMAALRTHAPLSEIPVSAATSKDLVGASPDETVEAVEAISQTRTESGAASSEAPSSTAESRSPASTPSPPAGAVYRVKSIDGGWEVYDRDGNAASEMFMTQSDAVVHAKELAHRDGSAQIIVHAQDGSIVSEFFYQRDERSSLSFDDSLRAFAASRPARARRGPMT
jgi:CBS domain-containing protein